MTVATPVVVASYGGVTVIFVTIPHLGATVVSFCDRKAASTLAISPRETNQTVGLFLHGDTRAEAKDRKTFMR